MLNLLKMSRAGELNIAGNHFAFRYPPDVKFIRALHQNVGMVFQQYNPWPHLMVRQNLIEAPCRGRGLDRSSANAPADKFLVRLWLQDYADRFLLYLSGGQQLWRPVTAGGYRPRVDDGATSAIV